MGVLQDIRRTNERGHSCDFCVTHAPVVAENNGLILLLGTAEIRVLADDGLIHAAPNMIFHYVSMHHYRPPIEFSRALRNGVKPSEKEYFDRWASWAWDGAQRLRSERGWADFFD